VQALSPEQAFLVRVFAQHCASAHDAKHDARLAAALPDVTDFALRIMNDYHDLRARIDVDTADDDDEADEEAAAREEARMDREFALGELLRIAAGVDYGDELGRRNMFKLTSK
jgi:condensin complex subunit 3